MTEKMEAARKGRKGGDPNPLYYKVQLELKRMTESGKWAPGDVIPPEKKIAEEQGVSLGTVRKAILNLVAEGYLYRVQGKGTMVAGTTMIRENLRYYRFFKDFGYKEAILKIKLLDISTIPAQERINRLLKMNAKGRLYLLRRRFTSQGTPLLYSISYLPRALLAGLDEFSRYRLEKVPVYISVEDKFGIPTVANQEMITAAAADQETAQVLEVEPGSPLLKIEMLSLTHKRKPYEYRITYVVTDRLKVLREY